jgi:hypothetical protein
VPATLPPTGPARYGCHEFRDDAELVLGGRAMPHVTELYREHRRTCGDCRRFHERLGAAYAGPSVPAGPGEAHRAREFGEILRRRAPAPGRAFERRLVPAGVVALSATAAALGLSLLGPRPGPTPMGVADPVEAITTALPPSLGVEEGGIGHRAQSFGRIVAGSGVLTDAQANLIPADTFGPGTHFNVVGPDALQIGLAGKILANLEPGSRGSWDAVSPGAIELTLERGRIAMRYERRAADPVLQVRTPTAVVRVTGTIFTVAVDGADRTVVSVLRGEVSVHEPRTGRLLAEVEAGYRFDVASSSYGDVGRDEVAAALPLSVEPDRDGTMLADGLIPESWVVPGLPPSGELRRLDQVIRNQPAPEGVSELTLDADTLDRRRGTESRRRGAQDEGDDLLDLLIADAQRARAAELARELQHCRELYASADTRFRAASCLTRFMRTYGDEPGAVEGLLLIGILRMDFAHDYQSANLYFEEFLRRAPDHEKAELATYKRWLASTESGKIPEALDRGAAYLERYPHGAYVGRILARFPELKREL